LICRCAQCGRVSTVALHISSSIDAHLCFSHSSLTFFLSLLLRPPITFLRSENLLFMRPSLVNSYRASLPRPSTEEEEEEGALITKYVVIRETTAQQRCSGRSVGGLISRRLRYNEGPIPDSGGPAGDLALSERAMDCCCSAFFHWKRYCRLCSLRL